MSIMDISDATPAIEWPRQAWRMVIANGPGIILALLISLAASLASGWTGIPTMVLALLLGMACYPLSKRQALTAGVNLSAGKLLKIGVALLGVRVTLGQIISLGAGPAVMAVGLILATLICGLVLAKVFSKSHYFGLLTAGAVAICGSSAALALASVLPNTKDMQRDTLFTVVAVTSLSTLAMVTYPFLFAGLDFNQEEIGVLLGATIHNVSQVVGAGFAVSDETGEIATYVKLLRIACLPIVVIGFAILSGTSAKGDGVKGSFPWFVVGFGVIFGLNSLGIIPETLRTGLDWASGWLLIIAIAALGMKTSLAAMLKVGVAHIGVIVLETAFLCTAAVFAMNFI